jgi:hypothetical protein
MSLRLQAVLPIAAAVVLTLPSAARANDRDKASHRVGWFGLSRDLRLEASVGQASYTLRDGVARTGAQVHLQMEGGKFVKASQLGNLAGIEVLLGFGYNGASGDASGNPTGAAKLSGVREVGTAMFDLAVGFPVTLLHWSDSAGERLLVGIAPGVGVNFRHGYLSLKAKAVLRLTTDLVAEFAWQWVPGTVSLPMADRPINHATLKGSLYWGAPGDRAWFICGEYGKAQWEEEQPGLTNAAYFGGQNPFTRTLRGPFEDTLTLGGGLAF